MAGRKLEISVAADASHSLSVEYAVFVNILPTNQLNDTVKSHSPTLGLRPLGICRLRSLSEQHFHGLRKCSILESRGSSLLGVL
jgi:hypothetical protein